MDGFGRLYQAMQAASKDGQLGAPVWMRQGTILSASPLKVDVGGTQQEAGRFYIAQRLLDGHSEQVTVSGLEYGGDATVTQRGPVLTPGDLVLLLTDDDQTFYLIDKVVHL